jgi:fatty acid-binding protein DegV
MQKVAVITDSLSGLTRELIEKYDIGIVPIRLLIKGKVYRDLIDITPAQAYQFLAENPESFATSPSSPWDYKEAFQLAVRKTGNICCVTISSGLSNAFNVACIAREQVSAELPGVNIEVMDSRTVTASEGFVVLAAARAAAEDKGLPDVMLEAGITRMLSEMEKKVGDLPVHAAIMHADVPEGAEKLRKRIASEFNCADLWITEFTPVMGYATGRGTIGVAYYSTSIPSQFIVNYFNRLSS